MSSATPGDAPLADFYGQDFYAEQMADSERSAREYLSYLASTFLPASVLDVGCGRGTWLKVFLELGSDQAYGYDGPWNTAGDMLDRRISFRAVDLNQPFEAPARVDLAMTLEVAEHLNPASAESFVSSLASASDAVMFGAAYTGQGGTNHINEQPHSYWGNLFASRGFDVFDVFRPRFWGNANVCFWYRQNVFLYLKRGTPVQEKFIGAGFRRMENVSFLDCIHPELYALARRPPSVPPNLGTLARSIMPAVGRSFRHRFDR